MPKSPAVVACNACMTRFRIDRELIEGYRAARFRCRRCGNPILIVIPGSQGIREPAFTGRTSGTADPPPASFSPRSTPPGAMRRVATQSSCSIELVNPVAGTETPDNLESLDRFREANRIHPACGELDISANISTEIPHDIPEPGDPPPPAPTAEDPVPRSTEGPVSLERSEFLEAAFRWKDTDCRKPYTLRYSVKEILCIIVFATTIAYCGVHLFLSGIRWLQGVLAGIKN